MEENFHHFSRFVLNVKETWMRTFAEGTRSEADEEGRTFQFLSRLKHLDFPHFVFRSWTTGRLDEIVAELDAIVFQVQTRWDPSRMQRRLEGVVKYQEFLRQFEFWRGWTPTKRKREQRKREALLEALPDPLEFWW